MTLRIKWNEQQALKPLKKLQTKDFLNVFDAIQDLQNDPFPQSSKKLVGEDTLFRERVGDYRIIYEVVEEDLVLHKIGHRRDIYDD